MREFRLQLGGEEIVVPELNFKQLKRLHPLMKQMQEHQAAGDEEAVMNDVSSFIEILLLRTPEPLSAEQIDDRLTASELMDIQKRTSEVLVVNGLQAPEGEPAPAKEEAESPSTGTSTL